MTTVDEFELPKACVMRVVKAAVNIIILNIIKYN